jgi:gas vesicle protein
MDERNYEHNYEHEHDAVEPGSYWAGMLIALLIGGLMGAVTMLLLAPQSGKKTRAMLRRQSHELRKQTAETLETVEDAVAGARDKTDEIVHDARKHAETLEKRGQALLDGHKGS